MIFGVIGKKIACRLRKPRNKHVLVRTVGKDSVIEIGNVKICIYSISFVGSAVQYKYEIVSGIARTESHPKGIMFYGDMWEMSVTPAQRKARLKLKIIAPKSIHIKCC